MKKKQLKNYLAFSTMGLEIGLSLVIGFFIGRFADDYFNSTPFGVVIGCFLGVVAGFRLVYQKIKKIKKWLKDEK